MENGTIGEGEAPARPAAERLLPAAIALAALAVTAFSPAIFEDGDTSWHLAAGRLILERMAVPHTDPFSFTFQGHPWVAHEWLSEALMAAVYGIAGWSGLAVLFGGAVAALLAIIGNEARRWLPPTRAAILVLLAGIPLFPFTLARPHVLAWPLLAGWTALLMRARERGEAPPWWTASLMLLWANLHGSFVFGLLLIAPFALEALVAAADKRAALLRWGLFGLLCLAVSLLTPHGLRGLLYPLQISAMKALPLIAEWRATVPAQSGGFTIFLLAIFFLCLLRGVRVPPLRLLLLTLLVYLAFAHMRHQAVLAIVGAMLLAEPVGRSFAREAPEKAQRIARGPAAALLLLILAVAAIRLALPVHRPDSDSNPLAAIAALPPALRARPVYNSYAFGGPLILAGIRPYIDGRGDMYGDAFLFEASRIDNGDVARLERAVRRYAIAWTILQPEVPLVRALDRDPRWRRLSADRWAVVHVRR